MAPVPEQTDSPAYCVSTALKGPLYPKWRKLFHPNLISSSVAALAKQYFNIIKECAIVCNLNLPLCAGSQVLMLPRNEILSGNSWWLCCVRKQGHLEFERCTGCLRGDSTHTDTHVHGTWPGMNWEETCTEGKNSLFLELHVLLGPTQSKCSVFESA